MKAYLANWTSTATRFLVKSVWLYEEKACFPASSIAAFCSCGFNSMVQLNQVVVTGDPVTGATFCPPVTFKPLLDRSVDSNWRVEGLASHGLRFADLRAMLAGIHSREDMFDFGYQARLMNLQPFVSIEVRVILNDVYERCRSGCWSC